MKLISVNVGLPRDVEWQGEIVRTSIWKQAVEGRVRVRRLNLDGDAQSDLTAHGGVWKAVYAYPSEHYPAWREELGVDLQWGAFGENLTTEGLREDQLEIGDRLRMGGAEFVVTQPRLPCFKLGIRHGRPTILKEFLVSGRSGTYLAVTGEGDVAAGDPIEFVERAGSRVTVTDLVRFYRGDQVDREVLARAVELEALPAGWRTRIRRELDADPSSPPTP